MQFTEKERRQLGKLLLATGAATAVICFIIALFFRAGQYTGVLKQGINVIKPFIYGGAIAYLLHPLVLFFERHLTRLEQKILKKRHPGALRLIGILLATALLLVVVVMLLMAVLPQVVTSVSSLVGQLPDTISRFETWITQLDQGETSHEVITVVQGAVDTLSERLQNFLQTDLLPTLQSMVSNVTSSFMNLLSFLKNFGLGLIISSYLLGGWEKYLTQAGLLVYALFPKRAADWIRREAHVTDRMFSGFIHGKLLDSLVVGILCFAFSCIARMPYAVLISVIVGVTNIIPFFGPYLGAIPSALLVLTVSPGKSLVFLIFIIILQQFDGNVLGPAILGDRLGISGIWILFSILVFSSLWGIVGMLIGVPVFAVLYDLIRSLVYRLLRLRGEQARITGYEAAYHQEAVSAPKKEKEKEKGGKKRI